MLLFLNHYEIVGYFIPNMTYISDKKSPLRRRFKFVHKNQFAENMTQTLKTFLNLKIDFLTEIACNFAIRKSTGAYCICTLKVHLYEIF
jgi:hypothetical protein